MDSEDAPSTAAEEEIDEPSRANVFRDKLELKKARSITDI
jgi:hypothetical protein